MKISGTALVWRIRTSVIGLVICGASCVVFAGDTRTEFKMRLDREAAETAYQDKRGIVFTLYTVSDGVMKMNVQLYPLKPGDPDVTTLELLHGSRWDVVAESKVITPGWTAPFRVESWDASKDIPFRVRHGDSEWTGIIRRDPIDKQVIVAAVFSCNSHKSGGGGLDKSDVVENINRLDPDMIFWTGDQVYDHDLHTRYWIRFGEDFGDMMRDRPTVCMVDDHDVGQPNIWGAGGRKAELDTDGGYTEPVPYVQMVERAQTSHLPDPYDPTPIDQGIGVYYTDWVWGGISFAIIEDRKFKSGCKGLLTKEMGPRPDHVTQPDVDPAQFDVPGKKLLGDRQLTFLGAWAQDWAGAEMKCVVSQTVFSMVSNYHGGKKYHYHMDLDANGWPQSGRNRAIREMRKAFAFHIAGDQHLASFVQYGVDEWRDSGYCFVVPAVANLWPRWWQPSSPGLNRESGSPEFTGDHLDGFGNKITVFAAGNPYKTGREPGDLHDRMPGFGVVKFNKASRDITVECWPRLVDITDPQEANQQYRGWPRTINQLDNYGRGGKFWLPEISVVGMNDPVIQVIRRDSSEVIYTLRIKGNSFQPYVFEPGTYTITVGEPAEGRIEVLTDLLASAVRTDMIIDVDLN